MQVRNSVFMRRVSSCWSSFLWPQIASISSINITVESWWLIQRRVVEFNWIAIILLAGLCSCAILNSSRTSLKRTCNQILTSITSRCIHILYNWSYFSLCPKYFEIRSAEDTEKKVALDIAATTLAKWLLPCWVLCVINNKILWPLLLFLRNASHVPVPGGP